MQRNLTPQTWDHAMTWGDYQLPVNDEIFIYYGGYAHGHKADRFNERQIGFARMKRDRYIAQSAADQSGTLRTRPLALDGSRLTVNARADEIRVRLLDESGSPNTRAQDAVLHGDSTAHQLNWNLKSVADSPVRLEFTLRNGDLYGFDVT
jgi:hypothetical protein